MKSLSIFFLLITHTLTAGNFFFVLYDMGESVNFIPVIEKLVEEGEKVEVLMLGTAKAKYQLPEEILYPHSLELATRFSTAPNDYMKALTEHVQSAVIVTGVSTLFAKQVHEAFYEREDIRLISYWDNLQVSGVSEYFTVAQEVANVSQEILVPSERTREGIARAEVVGYPSLEQRSIPIEIKRDEGKKLITYIGSYDREESYQRAWRWFSHLWSEMSHDDIQLVFIPHPKSAGGRWEATEFEKIGATLTIESSTYTTEFIKASDFVLCERTSTAEKAALLGTPVVHVLPSDDPYSTALLAAGVTKRVSSVLELEGALQNLGREGYSERAFDALGIPSDGLDRTLKVLNSH